MGMSYVPVSFYLPLFMLWALIFFFLYPLFDKDFLIGFSPNILYIHSDFFSSIILAFDGSFQSGRKLMSFNVGYFLESLC